MSLEVKKSHKKYIPYIIWGVVILIAGVLIARVAIWEKNYYEEKEGSERATAGIVGDVETTEVSDEVVTEEQQKEYTVAANKPRYLTIEKLGIKNARIFEVGVNSKGQMETPNTNYDAGWYNGSSLPGTGGTAILDGHNGGPSSYGIFKKLNTLVSGDIIKIEMGDGRIFEYRVYDNFEVKLSEADKKMSLLTVSPVAKTESISIISCIGEYSLKQKTYLSRQFLRATRV
ncbi:MAG: class F sortase [Candidatus Saccharibacteria bacterium]|nr:class F sortase [Candidatus Saccharibacteria bacterium]